MEPLDGSPPALPGGSQRRHFHCRSPQLGTLVRIWRQAGRHTSDAMASRLVPGQISRTCAGPDPFTTAAHCVWGNVRWNPRRPRPSPVSGWWKTRYHAELHCGSRGCRRPSPCAKPSPTQGQHKANTRPDVRAALTLQGVWRASVGLENRTVAVGGPNQPESHKPAAAICCVWRK